MCAAPGKGDPPWSPTRRRDRGVGGGAEGVAGGGGAAGAGGLRGARGTAVHDRMILNTRVARGGSAKPYDRPNTTV